MKRRTAYDVVAQVASQPKAEHVGFDPAVAILLMDVLERVKVLAAGQDVLARRVDRVLAGLQSAVEGGQA